MFTFNTSLTCAVHHRSLWGSIPHWLLYLSYITQVAGLDPTARKPNSPKTIQIGSNKRKVVMSTFASASAFWSAQTRTRSFRSSSIGPYSTSTHRSPASRTCLSNKPCLCHHRYPQHYPVSRSTTTWCGGGRGCTTVTTCRTYRLCSLVYHCLNAFNIQLSVRQALKTASASRQVGNRHRLTSLAFVNELWHCKGTEMHMVVRLTCMPGCNGEESTWSSTTFVSGKSDSAVTKSCAAKNTHHRLRHTAS